MILISCVDDRFGMSFNHRRLSRDKIVVDYILKMAEGHTLRMNEYSSSLFEGAAIKVDPDFMVHAGSNDICFVEDISVIPYESEVSTIVLFFWNRKYPYDLCFDIPLECNGWAIIDTEELIGHSHEKITKKVFTR